MHLLMETSSTSRRSLLLAMAFDQLMQLNQPLLLKLFHGTPGRKTNLSFIPSFFYSPSMESESLYESSQPSHQSEPWTSTLGLWVQQTPPSPSLLLEWFEKEREVEFIKLWNLNQWNQWNRLSPEETHWCPSRGNKSKWSIRDMVLVDWSEAAGEAGWLVFMSIRGRLNHWLRRFIQISLTDNVLSSVQFNLKGQVLLLILCTNLKKINKLLKMIVVEITINEEMSK